MTDDIMTKFGTISLNQNQKKRKKNPTFSSPPVSVVFSLVFSLKPAYYYTMLVLILILAIEIDFQTKIDLTGIYIRLNLI